MIIISAVGTYNTITDKSDVYSFWVVLIELISSMPVVLAARERDEVNLANIVIKKIQKRKLSELVDPSYGFESNQPASSSKTSLILTAFTAGQAATFKMFETIKRQPDIDAYDTGGRLLDDISGDIELKKVCFSYTSRPDKQIFNGFSISIPSGTTAALNIAYGKNGPTDEEIGAAAELANVAKFIDKFLHVVGVIFTVLLLGLQGVRVVECRVANGLDCFEYPAISCRKHSAVLTDFGGVGDGKTSNTKAFQYAISNLSHYASDGGALLVVPPGKWLTGSFNLTSHFTLFLQKEATILGSQDESEWPTLPVLPSYGRGRDAPDGRFSSLIFGTNLTDVVITGYNGTIDGQGSYWWDKFHKGELKLTRPYMIEIMFSDHIQISNLTLIDSPSWFVHPIYSSDIIIQGLTILAPVDSPNTDGINPDSCSNTRIEDCYIVSGDDCVAIKSGWDESGIKFGMPSQHIIIRRLECVSPDSAMIALGSEMSGGIRDVRAEELTALNTQSAVRIKTAVGRGAYVRDIFVKGMNLNTMKYVFWMTGSYGSHPNTDFDPKALPNITGINYRDVIADNVTYSARLEGIANDPFTGICISNVTIHSGKKKPQWNCTDIEGVTSNVYPKPCELLPLKEKIECPYPDDKLPIESVQLKTCSFKSVSFF
ncbi:probable polygalacturonase [Glycine soja]|uniref:probable polygalacturonase n=1 Tax=Glycine soja TaxID=3848 RepID=UPI00103B56AD|nr:probable polygalacturonase [Glycine soja]